jgi:5-(carboxyamino)imidazole ribonucleotide mutase
MLNFGHDPGRSTAQARPSHLIQIETTEATQRMQTMIEIVVGIVMGSQSDWATMKEAAAVLDELDVRYEAKIVSAHRTPERLRIYGNTAVERGLKVIIAGAGGAAHLPGMMAAHTRLPVLGVPVQSRALSGLDSLYSIVQMPKGVPVGTMAIGAAGAANAGLMAASILAIDRPDVAGRVERWRSAQSDSVAEEPVDE